MTLWEVHSHAMVWELQCTVIEKYQILKSVDGILFPQQTLESILSEMLHVEGYDVFMCSNSNSNA